MLQGPDTNMNEIAKIRDAVAVQEDVAVEILNYKKNGSAFWNALFVSPVFNGENNLIYYFASQLDVTRRKESGGQTTSITKNGNHWSVDRWHRPRLQ